MVYRSKGSHRPREKLLVACASLRQTGVLEIMYTLKNKRDGEEEEEEEEKKKKKKREG